MEGWGSGARWGWGERPSARSPADRVVRRGGRALGFEVTKVGSGGQAVAVDGGVATRVVSGGATRAVGGGGWIVLGDKCRIPSSI